MTKILLQQWIHPLVWVPSHTNFRRHAAALVVAYFVSFRLELKTKRSKAVEQLLTYFIT